MLILTVNSLKKLQLWWRGIKNNQDRLAREWRGFFSLNKKEILQIRTLKFNKESN